MSLVNPATGEIVEPLTADEAARLRVQERAIERGADEVARALGVIRDERLYRASYATFEDYCRERWGMTRQHANRQIVAAEVAAVLEPMGSKVPERQARELADLRDQPDRLREVYTRAHEATGGKVTAAAIRAARTPEPASVDAAVAEFPDLTYYAETGRADDAVQMADDLRRYRERGELADRLATLRRSIDIDQSKRDGTYVPPALPKVCHACGQALRSQQ